MAPSVKRSSHRKRRRSWFSYLWPGTRTRRRVVRRFLTAPWGVRETLTVVLVISIWFLANGIYQIVRKPTELYFPVSEALFKAPAETWRTYGSIFREHSTAVMTPPLLAALAQVEGSGNPLARTYWRWQATWNLFELYRPASSAVGMFQITDGTFQESKRYCIHDHVVATDGPWYNPASCWFNILYMRVLPSHSVEMTSALLDHQIAIILTRLKIDKASLQQQQDLAAVIHLCGAGTGDAYARRRFTLLPGQRCGTHDVRVYLGRVNSMKREFERLALADEEL